MFKTIALTAAVCAVSLAAGFTTIDVVGATGSTNSFQMAETVTKENRDDRQDDRQDDRDDRQDTREDCREAEGAGKDKRDCKQDGRQDRNSDG